MLMDNAVQTEKMAAESKDQLGRLWSICRAAERNEIARALEEHGQNRTHAAVALGISRRTLLNKIKQYGLTREECKAIGANRPAG
jgi:sigma-54 dependent transcriptional regulator, acetoin dehydrogenase operon transcriptional activator AcoR